MNIGEIFYCSRCLKQLDQEGVCIYCGYDPSSYVDADALEEGTLLCGKRFQVGAVNRRMRFGFLYGAYDFLKQKPVFIFEFFPSLKLDRDPRTGTIVIVSPENEARFNNELCCLKTALGHYCCISEENHTLYLFDGDLKTDGEYMENRGE